MVETEPYRPSNGSEGECFQSEWCNRCEKDRYESKPCRILGRTFFLEVDDPKYPKEWIHNKGEWPGEPRCTAFVERGSVVRSATRHVRDKRQEGLPI